MVANGSEGLLSAIVINGGEKGSCCSCDASLCISAQYVMVDVSYLFMFQA